MLQGRENPAEIQYIRTESERILHDIREANDEAVRLTALKGGTFDIQLENRLRDNPYFKERDPLSYYRWENEQLRYVMKLLGEEISDLTKPGEKVESEVGKTRGQVQSSMHDQINEAGGWEEFLKGKAEKAKPDTGHWNSRLKRSDGKMDW